MNVLSTVGIQINRALFLSAKLSRSISSVAVRCAIFEEPNSESCDVVVIRILSLVFPVPADWKMSYCVTACEFGSKLLIFSNISSNGLI